VILALETSTAAASAAAVGPDGELLGTSLTTDGPLQARRLLEGVHEALSGAGAGLDEVATIVCGLGPGTFTGLRIGVATARALAQAAGLPLAGVPSLEALACGLAADAGAGATHFVPLIDGRRNEVFAAVYRHGPPAARTDLELVVELTVVGAADLPTFLERWPGAVVGGDGAALHADLLPATVVLAAGAAGPAAGPSALMVARTFLAGSPAIRRGFDETLPIYGRAPDAVPRAAKVSSSASVSPSSRRPSS
jgi:tRNA threonylcarbamoyladenosine biosynthesis protein TsaB